MITYHKIQTIYKRELNGSKRIIERDFSTPEFEYLKNNTWDWREKIDGMNIRVRCDLFENWMDFQGKTDRAEVPKLLVEKLHSYFTLDKFKYFFQANRVCLYGEGFGPKIQSGGKYLPYQDFILFDVFVDGWWLKREDIECVANSLGISIVPIIGSGNLLELSEFVKKGFNSQWGNFIAEGVVATPKLELKNRQGGRIITKIKYKDFN
jgi:hypothetical protein